MSISYIITDDLDKAGDTAPEPHKVCAVRARFTAAVLILGHMPKNMSVQNLSLNNSAQDMLSRPMGFCGLSKDGEIQVLTQLQACDFIKMQTRDGSKVLTCHAPYMRQRLNTQHFPTLDVLELYAFVYPTRFVTPTPLGIARSLCLNISDDPADLAMAMLDAVECLLFNLRDIPRKEYLVRIAEAMGQNGRGWGWTPYVMEALGQIYNKDEIINSTRQKFNVWSDLVEWSDTPSSPPHSNYAVEGHEARERLEEFLRNKYQPESRSEQMNYAMRVAEAFAYPAIGQPGCIDLPSQDTEPNVVLAEAGTGIGKTLGYLAPASVWAEKNGGNVWVSTYTKNLQRQIAGELERIYPDREVRDKKVAIRKGRENYLCLLNLSDLAASVATTRNPLAGVAAGLMARWVMTTEDGDMTGAGFHGWLPGLMGQNLTLGLADRRGECIYSACDHYHRCFVERSIRKSFRTPLVIANHAIVMIKAAHHDEDFPPHIVFDEAHHIFDAADATFCAALTGSEMHDLRRWLAGPEGVARSRARGLKRRLQDVVDHDAACIKLVEEIVHRAAFLPAFDWLNRIIQNTPQGNAETFLALIRSQILSRIKGENQPYSLEIEPFPIDKPLMYLASELHDDVKLLRAPIARLANHLREKLANEIDSLSTDTQKRIETVALSLERRVRMLLTPWLELLVNFLDGETPTEFVDWMELNRLENYVFDIGLHRHFKDPLKPMAKSLRAITQSVTMTSATLRDHAQESSPLNKDAEIDMNWGRAGQFTGANYLTRTPVYFSINSPYNYAAQTRVFIANDISKDDLKGLARAYENLFITAGGGALGIFTSISRLRRTHVEILPTLMEMGLALYAQHVDGIETGTLIDMFRDDIHSCLLGTDAVRDGVDVPGDALRMIVFDRVPWPRRTILHRARRAHFGGAEYDDYLTRLKLKQAYGRLVRSKNDRGVFVMLDSATPSRLLNAFPAGVQIEKIGIAEIIKKCQEFWVRETS